MSPNLSPGDDGGGFVSFSCALSELSAPTEAPEAQGIIAGLLTAQGGLRPEDTELLGVGGLAPLKPLVSHLHAQLDAGDLGWVLALPGDDVGFEEQIEALAAFCQGYLFGLLHHDPRITDALDAVGQEALSDLFEISKADPQGAGGESDEANLAELSEYVRTAVQFLYEALAPPPATA